MGSKTLMERLEVMRFPLILGVVFIHAYGTNVGILAGPIGVGHSAVYSEFVRNLISQGIARVSVPLLFLTSGYLFFANFTESGASYARKLKSRIHTLLIPFLFWNLLTLLLIAMAQALPASHVYFSGKHMLVADFAAIDYVKAIFGVGRAPVSYQFWFVRDLMVLVVLTPLISVLLRNLPAPLLLALAGCWFLEVWPVEIPAIEAALFFCIGCFLAIRKISLFALDGQAPGLAVAYALLVIADALLIGTQLSPYLHKIAIPLGMVTALYLTKFTVNHSSWRRRLLYLSAASFFVFAAHEPLLTVVKKTLYKTIYPDSDWQVLALYFCIPTAIVVALVFAYRSLKSTLPAALWKMMNGGR